MPAQGGMHRHQGAGLYFEIAPSWVWIGGGMYAPEPSHLVKVRDHIADLEVTLPALLERGQGVAMHFWFANYDGVRGYNPFFGGIKGGCLERVNAAGPLAIADMPQARAVREGGSSALRQAAAEVPFGAWSARSDRRSARSWTRRTGSRPRRRTAGSCSASRVSAG